jgi:hypothetical protein
MGSVWLAEHLLLGRPVAVKVIRPEMLARPGAAGRFAREMRAVARLAHPNIVAAYDADDAAGTHFLVMEYVDGRTLADRLADGPVPAADACRWVRDAALGLHHAHAAGLTHRDVKPHNLMLAADGTVKVLDFGLAAAADAGPEGAVVGTPAYMAPEQAADPAAAGPPADVYALGGTLYHLLAGRPPFPPGPADGLIAAHRGREPEPLTGVPPGLAAMVARMMAKQPADRHPSAAAVADALAPFCGDPTPARPRPGHRVALGLLAAAVVAAAGVVIVRDRDGQTVATVSVPDGGSVTVTVGPAADDPATGEPFRVIPVTIRSRIWPPALSADGRRVVVPGGRGVDACLWLTVYDTATGERLYELTGEPDRAITDYAFSADGKRLVAAMTAVRPDGFGVWVADVDAGRHRRAPFPPLPGWPCQLSLSADGRRVSFGLEAADPASARGVWAADLDAGRVLLRPDRSDRPAVELSELTADGGRAVVVQWWAAAAGRPARGRVVVHDLTDPARTTAADTPFNLGYPVRDADGRMHAWRPLPAGGLAVARIDPATAAVADLPVPPVRPITAAVASGRGGVGRWFLTFDPDRREVRVHDLRSGRTRFVAGPVADHVQTAIAADGRTLAVFAGSQVRLYRIPPAGDGP